MNRALGPVVVTELPALPGAAGDGPVHRHRVLRGESLAAKEAACAS